MKFMHLLWSVLVSVSIAVAMPSASFGKRVVMIVLVITSIEAVIADIGERWRR